MTRFINSPGAVVTDAIDGVLAARGPDCLARLDGYPHTKVVFRPDADRRKVAVVSGGGSGHEPAHIGYVGTGMLTGAVAGEVFASPSVDAVLACILAVTGDGGCLLVVKNYTGDRLNFGLAAERAKQLGLAVEMVIVADDIALPDTPHPRGVAGTVFVHKVAGYLAEQGADLATVKTAAERVAGLTRSLGLSLATCDLPGQPKRSHESAPELGLGIHGEPGAETIDIDGATHAVSLLVDRLIATDPTPDAPLAVLVNNLGAVTPLEMSIITGELLRSPLGARVRLLIGPGPFMTSLNMVGFSLSVLPLDDELETALTAPVTPIAWLPAARVQDTPVHALPAGLARDAATPSPHADTEAMLRRVCAALIGAEAELNALDAKVGDGDTGTTFAHAARAIGQALDAGSLPLASPGDLMIELGHLLSTNMGGSSGVLLAILFTTAGNAVSNGAGLVQALIEGAESVQRYGGAKRGDRTMLDALLPALDTLAAGAGLSEATEAAAKGAEATRNMRRAGAGRSAYLRADSLHGTVDPGAAAVGIVIKALATG